MITEVHMKSIETHEETRDLKKLLDKPTFGEDFQ
jgi:hypothetical protein